MFSFLNELNPFHKSRQGYVNTFKVTDNVLCRALIAEDGEVISSLDCSKLPDDHPQLKCNNYTVQIRGREVAPHTNTQPSLVSRVEKVQDKYKLNEGFEIKI